MDEVQQREYDFFMRMAALAQQKVMELDRDGTKLEIGDTIMYWTLPNRYGFRMSSIVFGFDGDEVIVSFEERWPLKDVRFLWKNSKVAIAR